MSHGFDSRLRRIQDALANIKGRGANREAMERLAVEYKDQPARFNAEVLGRSLWSKQVEVCDAVARNQATIVPAGRACGKSFILSGLVLWFIYTHRPSRVVTTGPDHRQVCSVLWGEIKKALRHAAIPLSYERLTAGFVSPQRLVLDATERHEAMGFAARTTEGFSGQHAGEMLVIVDEASGITEDIWQAIDGLHPSKLVVAGNPLRHDSRFRELHDLAVAGTPDIATVPISCLEAPDARNERSLVGMVDASFLRYCRIVHGEGSPWWNSNVLAQFPGQESVRFFPSQWLDRCTDESCLNDELWLDYAPGPVVMAIDIGGGVGADRSVIVVRNGKRLLEVFASEWHGVLDEARHRLEPVVVELARKWCVPGSYVTYDKSGIGRSFGSYLERYGLYNAVGYYSQGRGGRYFTNRRSANAYALKRRLDPHDNDYVPFYCGGIPEWPELRGELALIHDGTMDEADGEVRQSIETKEELQARMHGKSPDLADAFIQSWTYRGQ